MRGDFSRDSFHPAAGFSRVLRQQGRIELDSDANEAQAIQLRFLRTLAADLMGPQAAVGDGFKVVASDALSWDFQISSGRFYVDGWPCENRVLVAWRGDSDHPGQPWTVEPDQPEPGAYIACLETWERHLSAVEHDSSLARATPGALREVALGGVDTAGRAQVIWRVVLNPVPANVALPTEPMSDADWIDLRSRWTGRRIPGTLRVRAARPGTGEADPCVVSPRASYRGLENHLYRIEISRGGAAGTNDDSATFIWSRDNGSTVLAVESIQGATVRLATGWRDAASAIGPGDHVEISSPIDRLDPGPGPIRRVTGYDPDSLTLTLDSAPGTDADGVADGVVVRRWDHVAAKPNAGAPKIADDHALELVEGQWLALEDGISIMFGEPPSRVRFLDKEPAFRELPQGTLEDVAIDSSSLRSAAGLQIRRLPYSYQKGDYWLFEARVELADVIWPRSDADPPEPLPMPPHGVERHLAPLASVTFAAQTGAVEVHDLRRTINPVYED